MVDEPAPVAQADNPQQLLAAVLENEQPESLLLISTQPVPALEHWCAAHQCALTTITDSDPLPALTDKGRFRLALVADQLEYMNHHAGEELLGRLRNLHTDTLAVLYQSARAPKSMRWKRCDFIAMGLRLSGRCQTEGGETALHTYQLASYNFSRGWNNPRYWANPENWGKYWW